MDERVILILGLAVGTFSIRLAGYALGAKLPTSGAWPRAFAALPGCLIAALISVMLVRADAEEWGAASLALLCAVIARSVPITMLVGIGAVWFLRSMG